MTNPEDGLVELEQLFRKGFASKDILHDIIGRSDVAALIGCWEGNVTDPISLFWGLYEPIRYSRPAGELPMEWEEVILQSLERLHRGYRVSYEPDGEVLGENDFQESLVSGHQIIPRKLQDLITFIHIAAARAFRIKGRQGGGLDEVALDCLREVDRAMARLSILDRSERGISEVLNRDPAQTFLLSTYTVGAKAWAELGKIELRKGSYIDALRYITEAVFESSYAAARYAGDEIYAIESNTKDLPLSPSCSLKEHLVAGLDNVTHQEIASVWLKLKEAGQTDSWMQVSRYCNFMLEANELPYIYSNHDGYPAPGTTDWFTGFTVAADPPLTTAGPPLTWTEFWYGAKVWVSAQLSPGEYRKMRDEDKKNEAESRLRTYFFGEDWAMLPDRAKDRLITADILWNSPANIAWEAVLNDLRIAMEDMCHKFIWQTLSGSKGGGQDLLKFIRLKSELDKGDKRPEIAICIQVCRAEYFRDFLKQQNLGKGDFDFLTKKLPSAMGQLQGERNFAEHQSTGSWRRETVEIQVRQFFGIGQPGILPELARIGRQLRRGN